MSQNRRSLNRSTRREKKQNSKFPALSENNSTVLPGAQSEIINMLVKKTLDRYNVRSNNQLTAGEKQRLRNIFYQLQEEVNQFLSEMSKTNNEENDIKKGNSHQ